MIPLLTLAILAAALATSPHAADEPAGGLRGVVLDAATGESVPAARVVTGRAGRETTADGEGRFALCGLPRRFTLTVSAPGYRDFSVYLALGPAGADLRVPMERAPPRLAESVTVEAVPPTGTGEPPSALSRAYSAEVLMQVGSVVASDPLRAVQALPGVAANDELNAGFAARGTGFDAVGLYLDGVRLRAPFHTVRDVNDGYTLTIFNGDVLDSVSLLPGTAPARYGDRIGATLAVRTREGRRDAVHGRASVGAAGAFATLEGPAGGRVSWLASARKSFLGYIVDRVEERPSLVLGWRDLTTRVSAHPRPSQALTLLGLFGRARYENTDPHADAHDMESAEAGTDLVQLSFRSATGEGTIDAAGFLLRETGDNRDTDGFQRFRSKAVSGGFHANGSRRLGSWRLDAGLEGQRVREDVVSRRFDDGSGEADVREDYRRDGWLFGTFAQGSWTRTGGGLVLTAGGRVDRFSPTAEASAVPRASVEVGLDARTRLVAGFGLYRQYPSLERLHGEHGNPALDAERSRQLAVALERRLGERLRARVELYAQRESRLAFSREVDYRLENGVVVPPAPDAVLANALAGPSRGVEVTLAAAPLGPLSGFVAYALAHARRDDGGGLSFDADFDQRHTVTSFVRARLGTSAFVSTAFRYGSGFPFAGFVERRGDALFVAAGRNGLRPPAYARWDVRGEKRFTRGRVSLDLYLEVANLLDRENVRYNEIDHVDPRTGRARMDQDTLLPRLPLFGATLEF